MKMEALIIQFLLREKKVTLQEIGHFTLHADVDLADDDQVHILDGGVTFTYDPKAVPDEGLIRFVMEKTKKIKPLAASDLDSFLMLGKQFLHIGKPFTLHRIGMLSKSQQGEIIFSQALTEKLDLENKKSTIEQNGSQETIDFTSNPTPARPLAWVLQAGMLTLVIGLLVFLFWFWQSDPTPDAVPSADSTSATTIDTIPPQPTAETYSELCLATNKDSLQASALYTRLQSMRTQDSIRIIKKDSVYRITWTYPRNRLDSAKAIDSAQKKYAVQPVFIP